MPTATFDCIADNLLQNALDKRNREPGIAIRLSLFWRNGICLEICDTGSAIRDEIAGAVLSSPVPSDNGLGVGLYQARQLAQQQGYRLEMQENRNGSVRFGIIQNPV